MKKAELLIRQFMSSKSYEKAAPEDKAALDEAVDKTEDIELSDEDIKKLLDENGKLKSKVKELEDQVKAANDGRERDKVEAIVSKGIDELNPLTEKVKEMMLKDIPWDTLKLEDGQIPGMDDVFEGIKEAYKGLYGNKGCGDGDVNTKEAPETVEVKEATDEIETKETPETPEVKSKSLKSGITFGVTTKAASTKTNVNKPRAGIYFN